MAAGLRGLLLFLIPLALADIEPHCEGYEVVDGFGMENVDMPPQIGVQVLGNAEEVADEQACWDRCCENNGCDLAVLSAGKCHLVRCTFDKFDMCDLTPQEGAKSYRKVNRGVRPKQDDFCLPEKMTGRCRALFRRWYYDAEKETCLNFNYGGCPVNLNNFAGKEECMQKCQGVKSSKPEPAKVQSPIKGNFEECCAAPAVVGNCRAAFTRWYYDPSSSSCQKFVYGGCKANKNNYLNEAACMSMCSGRTEDDGYVDPSVMHRSVTAVVLPILLALLAASLLGIMILFFVKVARKNQETAGFRAMWNPIDDKECLMNNAYTL